MSNTPKPYTIVAVFFGAILTVFVIYYFSWEKSGYVESTVSFDKETKEIFGALDKISSSFNPNTVDGQKCKAFVSVLSYEMRKDAVRNAHRYVTLYSNLAHTNALFVTIMLMIVTGLIFSIYQMATAYNTPHGTESQIEIEAANIKVRTGYVSIAVSAIAMIALSIYLPNAHEVREISGVETVVDFSLNELLNVCKKE